MIIVAACDICGSELKGNQIFYDDDGRELCKEHLIVQQICDSQSSYNEKAKWLEKTHLKSQRALLKKIEALTQELELNRLCS